MQLGTVRHRDEEQRLFRRYQERTLAVNGAVDRLAAETRRSPSLREIAEATGYSIEQVLEAMEAAVAHDAVSLDAPVSSSDGDGASGYADRIGEVDGRYELIEYWSVIDSAIRALPERERHVLALRFGEDLTQSQIAARIGVSQMHVSRLLRRALERLRAVAADA